MVQWPSSLLRLLRALGSPSIAGGLYWAWGVADDHGADQDRVLKTWPVLHRAAGEGSLGPMATRSAAPMRGFRGFMVPARFARYGVPFTGLFT